MRVRDVVNLDELVIVLVFRPVLASSQTAYYVDWGARSCSPQFSH